MGIRNALRKVRASLQRPRAPRLTQPRHGQVRRPLLEDLEDRTLPSIYLQYNGNDGTLTPHIRLGYLAPGPCLHYPLAQAGEPVFVKI